MSFSRRLGICCIGATVTALLLAIIVTAEQWLTPKGMHPAEAVFIFAAMISVYLTLACICCILANLIWLVFRRMVASLEFLLLPGLAAWLFFGLLTEAVRSAGFFAPGGRWVPAIILFVTTAAFLFMNSGKPEDV